MSREAMKQALEAFDALYVNDYSGYEISKHERYIIDDAITVLRQALVDADDTSQKRVDEKAKREQEPVITQEAVECMCGLCKLGKREWVGLTHPQIHELDWPDGVSFEDILLFVRAIEAKLKEKNG